jgi:hypothetical protein
LTLQDGLKIGSAVYAGTRDTYIGGEKRAESLNFGGEKALKTIEPKFRGLIRFAIFDFEGGPVPASAEIAAAKLKLYKERAYLAHVAAHEVLRDWSEKEVVWADASRKDKWAEPGCGAIGKDRSREPVASGEVDYAAGQWLELDVTASLRRWSARQLANHGWLLIDAHPKDSQNYREWCSREYAADPALRPKLEITYRK